MVWIYIWLVDGGFLKRNLSAGCFFKVNFALVNDFPSLNSALLKPSEQVVKCSFSDSAKHIE